MSIRPLGSNLIVEKVEKENVSSAGIILTRSDEADRAKVIAVGPDVTGVTVGDEVLINWQKSPLISGKTYKTNIEEVFAVFQ